MSCCAASRSDLSETATTAIAASTKSSSAASVEGMIALTGGSFLMGSNDSTFPADGEGPIREITVNPFWIDATTVTNAQFAQFVAATDYVTEAEQFGWSYVFYGFLPPDHPPTRGVQSAPWWRQVYGATWRQPEGPPSHIDTRADHPAVHVSWNDAQAYAAWAGKRLPTEAEWEYAARGGLRQKTFPWGDKLTPKGKHRSNVWQGKFPEKNTCGDGFVGTAPVRSFRPNKFGLYNMTGNVWEWCADWFSPTYHQQDSRNNPQGPSSGTAKVMKGGSYLCHASYCNRYRVSARTFNTPDSSTGHMGFRLVKDVD